MIFRNGKMYATIYDIWATPDENGVSVLDRVLHKLAETER